MIKFHSFTATIPMTRIFLVRPGATDFDDQGRIKGRLDIPLNEKGSDQVTQTVRDLAEVEFECIFAAPCQASQQTASALAESHGIKCKTLELLQNLDSGLWQGKLIEEVKNGQPKVYRLWQDQPETVCPPEGEMLQAARDRVRQALRKILRRHKTGNVAIIVPEPLATLVRGEVTRAPLGDLWEAECMGGNWEFLDQTENHVETELEKKTKAS